MSNLYRLVYSSFRKDSCNALEIKKILESSQKNNSKKGITGILLHSNSRFIQYMEGPKEKVEQLFESIEKDPRHSSVSRLSFQPIDQRIFPSWEMGFKDFTSKNIEFHTDISPKDMAIFQRLIDGELDFENDGLRVLQLFFRS